MRWSWWIWVSPHFSVFHPLCTMYQYHWEQNNSALRFENLIFTPPNMCHSSNFVSTHHLKAFGLSMWVTVNVKLDSDTGFSAISWQARPLVVPGLFLNMLTNFISSEAYSLGLIPDLSKVVTHSNNLYLRKTVWSDDLGICDCLEMASRVLKPVIFFDLRWSSLGLSCCSEHWTIQCVLSNNHFILAKRN